MPSDVTGLVICVVRELYYGLADHGEDMKYGVQMEEWEAVIGKGALFARRIASRRRLNGEQRK